MPLFTSRRPRAGLYSSLCAGLLALLTAAPAARAQTAPAWQWAQRAGGTGGDYGNNVAVDAAGNLYITGQFENTVTFGTTTLTSRGQSDAYLAKYTAGGALLWVQQLGGSEDDYGSALTLDAAGNAYVAGSFSGLALLGTSQLTSTGSTDIFVARFSPAGTLQWVQQGGGPSYDFSYSLAVDAGGAVYLTGSYSGTSCTFGATTLPGSAGSAESMLVTKLSPTGNWLWARGSTSNIGVQGQDVALSAQTGEVYVAGQYEGTARWGSTQLTSPRGSSSYLARLSSGGDWLSVQAGASGTSLFGNESVAVDAAGNTYVAGSFSGTTTIGSTVLTSSGAASLDGVITKYSPTGAVLWTRPLGGSGEDAVYALTLDAAGNVYVGGQFTGPATFGPLALGSSVGGSGDSWAAKLSGAGAWQWVQSAGSSGLDYVSALAVDGAGNAFAVGTYVGNLTLGGLTLPNAGDRDIYLARLGNFTLATAPPAMPRLLSLFPNPAQGQTALLLEPGAAGVATVVDALGRPVREQAFAAGTRRLDLGLAGLRPGVYRVLLTGSASRRSVPLVVE